LKPDELHALCIISIYIGSTFTHLLPNVSYKDPRLTEVTYHCINFNDRVRKVPKNYYLNVWNKKMRLLGMDTCLSLNDIMEIRCNTCTRSEQGYNF
jgi:hypothetical protein